MKNNKESFDTIRIILREQNNPWFAIFWYITKSIENNNWNKEVSYDISFSYYKSKKSKMFQLFNLYNIKKDFISMFKDLKVQTILKILILDNDNSYFWKITNEKIEEFKNKEISDELLLNFVNSLENKNNIRSVDFIYFFEDLENLFTN